MTIIVENKIPSAAMKFIPYAREPTEFVIKTFVTSSVYVCHNETIRKHQEQVQRTCQKMSEERVPKQGLTKRKKFKEMCNNGRCIGQTFEYAPANCRFDDYLTQFKKTQFEIIHKHDIHTNL